MVIQDLICSLFGLGISCGSWPMSKLLIEYLLVPSVLLIVILYFLSDWFLGGSGPKMRGLIAIVFYIVIVYSGLYASFAPLAYGYTLLFIILIGAIALLGRFFKSEHVGMVSNLYKNVKKNVNPEDMEKEVKLRVDDLEDLKHRIRDGYNTRKDLMDKLGEVKDKEKFYVDITGISNQISSLEDKKSQLFQEAERIIVDLPSHKKGKWEKELEDLRNDFRKLDKDLEKQEKDMEKDKDLDKDLRIYRKRKGENKN